MHTKLLTLAAAALLAAGLSVAQAQTTAPGTTAKQPKGELSVPTQDKGMQRPAVASDTTRQEVKAETRAAEVNGDIPKGEQSTPNQGKRPPKRSMDGASSPTRAEVKAEAAADNKAGNTPPGERARKDDDKGGAKGIKP